MAKAVHNELSLILSDAADERIRLLKVIRVEALVPGKHFLIVFGPPASRSGDTPEISGARDAEEILHNALGYIRSELATAVNFKSAPNLTFSPDPVLWETWGSGP